MITLKLTFLLSLPVVYIKEELKDAAFDVTIKPAVNSFVKKEDGFSGALIVEKQNQIIGANDSMDELVIKEEPQHVDAVSKYLSKDFSPLLPGRRL